jgi:PKD repeat protein
MGNHMNQNKMNRIFHRMALLSSFAALSLSCSKTVDPGVEPDVSLPFANYEIIPGDDPFTFEFKNLSKDYSQVEWRFGDDIVSHDVSPTHVYLKAGDYQVNLKATSESGGTARKMLDLKISPEEVFTVSAEKTSTPGDMQFKLITKAEVASASWVFQDKTSFTEFNLLKKFAPGEAQKLTVKIKSKKGSEAQQDLLASTAGIITNLTKKIVEMTSSHENPGGRTANEGTSKIIDNNLATKWYMASITFPAWNKFTFELPETVKMYAVGSGNDDATKDPKIWTFQGSNDGVNWEILDSRTMPSNFYIQAGNKYMQLFYYEVVNPKRFLHYRYHVTANSGHATRYQISEFIMFK